MGTRGVGADRGDQGWFAQRGRIDHRAGGRGAQHDHVGLDESGFTAVNDPQVGSDGFQQCLGLSVGGQAWRIQADALPVAQTFHIVQMRLRNLAAPDDCQSRGVCRSEGVDRHSRGRGGARGGQFGGIAEQQRLTGFHRHQQGPCRHQRTLLANDIRRGLHAVHAVFGQHAQIIDEVAGTLRKFHQLLRRLHGVTRRKITEQLAQDLRHINARQQLTGLMLVDHVGRIGHIRLRR
ncbi:hypothetical protein D3C84_694610 [compost metagenome]